MLWSLKNLICPCFVAEMSWNVIRENHWTLYDRNNWDCCIIDNFFSCGRERVTSLELLFPRILLFDRAEGLKSQTLQQKNQCIRSDDQFFFTVLVINFYNFLSLCEEISLPFFLPIHSFRFNLHLTLHLIFSKAQSQNAHQIKTCYQ